MVPAPKRLLSGVVPLETFLTTLQKVRNHVQHCREGDSVWSKSALQS